MQAKDFKEKALIHNLVLLGFVIALFFLNFYSKTLFYGPRATHQWRQTDCLSITKNYYEEGMHFFQPKIHYQGPKDGKAVSEMPLLNYSVAALWKIFGEHEFIYRLLEYLIFLTAMFVLYNTIGRLFQSWLLGFFSVSFIMTSPLITFYSANFIADVPALSIGIISFCLLLRFHRSKKINTYYAALFLGTLAVLMKASACMPLGLLLFFSLLDLTGIYRFFGTEKLFEKKLAPALTLLFAVVLIFAWYRYALSYNLNNTNNIFLLTVLPMWEMDSIEIIRNLRILCGDLFAVFLNRPMIFLFFTLVFYVIARFRSLSAFLKYSFVFCGAYFLFYLLFFFQVFTVHDYYLNNLMIFPVITLLCFAELNLQNGFSVKNKIFLRIFVCVVVLFNSFYAAAVYRMRMIEDDKLAQWFPFVSEEDRKLAKYLFWDYGNSIKKLENFRPALREHDIARTDLVLHVPDQSFDIALYFMDQKGFSISREHFEMDSTVTRHFRGKDIKYVIMSDTTLERQIAFKKISPFLEKYFSRGGIDVFKVKPGF